MVETTYNIPGSPRLALLADLHGRPYDHIISSLQAHRPSLACVVGDILYGSHPEDDRSPLDTQENVLPFLSGCAAVAPTFLSLGNHEWMLDEEDMERIAATGVVVLDNDYKTINIDGRKIVLAGLTSGYVTDYRRFVAMLDGKVRYLPIPLHQYRQFTPMIPSIHTMIPVVHSWIPLLGRHPQPEAPPNMIQNFSGDSHIVHC